MRPSQSAAPWSVTELLEAAVLVGTEHPPGIRLALALALDLHHLDDGLEAGALRGETLLLGAVRAFGILDREELSVREIRVVRDRDHVAGRLARDARPTLDALTVEFSAKPLSRRFVGEGDRSFDHPIVPEDDVAMDLREFRRGGVFVRDEGREAAARPRVVEARSGRLDVLPRVELGGFAGRAVLATERGRVEAGDAADDVLRTFLDGRGLEGAAIVRAELAFVGVRGGVGTKPDAAEGVGVIRDRGEVERTPDLHLARPASLLVEGREHARLAAREAVGVLGREPRVEDVGIHRVRGVDVEIAPVHVLLGIVFGASAVFRRRGHGETDAARGDEGEGVGEAFRDRRGANHHASSIGNRARRSPMQAGGIRAIRLCMADPDPGYFEDIELDREVEIGRYTPTKNEIVEFASRWDPQPFHIDEEAASRSVMGGLSASSCHTYSISSLIYSRSAHKLHTAAMLGMEMRFPNAVRPDEELTLLEIFVDKRPSASRPAYGVVRSRSIMRNVRGEDVMVSESNYLVDRRPGASVPA